MAGYPGWRLEPGSRTVGSPLGSSAGISAGSRPVLVLPSVLPSALPSSSADSGRGAKRQRIEPVAVKREPEDGAAATQPRAQTA
eukprot:COSAG03_NODE_3228_length_2134_cov_1.531695_2_plen_83_part_01